MARRVLLPALAAALVLTGAAQAATWPPATITGGGSMPNLAFTASGTPVISASFSETFSVGQERIFAGPGAAALSAELLAPPAPYGAGGVAYLRTTTPERPAPRRATVGVSLGDAAVARPAPAAEPPGPR